MENEQYVDLEILAMEGGECLVRISKNVLNTLTTFDANLVVRHWDGDKPVVLEPYGDSAVRTREDASEANNLDKLPQISFEALDSYLDIVS
jgi:hypothetical protein